MMDRRTYEFSFALYEFLKLRRLLLMSGGLKSTTATKPNWLVGQSVQESWWAVSRTCLLGGEVSSNAVRMRSEFACIDWRLQGSIARIKRIIFFASYARIFTCFILSYAYDRALGTYCCTLRSFWSLRKEESFQWSWIGGQFVKYAVSLNAKICFRSQHAR